MTTIQVFDKAMCCSTGVCGPQIDPVLAQFAADLDWLRAHGANVERFNLAQEPGRFVANSAVQELLRSQGPNCLPLVFVDGNLVDQAHYPDRESFGRWTGISSANQKQVGVLFPMISDCCDKPGCC